jgi:hypothetical protein
MVPGITSQKFPPLSVAIEEIVCANYPVNAIFLHLISQKDFTCSTLLFLSGNNCAKYVK